MSLTGRILAARASEAAGGAYRWYRPDLVLMPEYALSLYVERFERGEARPAAPERLLVVADHFSPPATVERADILRRVQDVTNALGLELRLFEGICHQLVIEDSRALPGSVIVGSDSHTVTAGGLGALAMGFGSTDVFAAVTADRVALREPEVVRVDLVGKLRAHVMGKDIMLEIFRRLGSEALSYRALELVDRSEGGVPQSDRFAICNMMAEAGGKAAMFVPDDITAAWLEARDGEAPGGLVALREAAGDDDFVARHEIDLSGLGPMVARPPDPFDVVPLAELAGLELQQVFVGSCNAGRLRDLAVVAGFLQGRTVASGLKAVAIPGSRKVYREALDAGYVRTLVEAGVVLESPSCGPCGAIDKGLLAAGERCAATINRNYRGRMGSPEAEVYLVSPAVAAASMLTGRLTDPGAPR